MQLRSLVRAATAAAFLGLVAPTAAQAQTFFFGTMNGSGNLGTPELFTLAGYGSVTATASTGFNLWAMSAGYGETGLGICPIGTTYHSSSSSTVVGGGTCAADPNAEIGNWSGGYVTMSLAVLPGMIPISFELASVQTGERFSYRQGTSCGSLGSAIPGTGPNDGNSLTGGIQSGAGNTNPFVFESLTSSVRCIQFNPVGTTSTGGSGGGDGEDHYTWSSSGDYLIYSLTFGPDGSGTGQSTVPEPASMTLLATGLVGMMAASRRRRKK